MGRLFHFIQIRRRQLLLAATALFLLVGLMTGLAWRELNTPMEVPGSVAFDVATGSSLTAISNQLTENGWLDHPRAFSLWARLSGVAGSLQAGEYELEPDTTSRQLLEKMVLGQVKQYQLTLVEGWTFQQALQALWRAPGIQPSLTELSPGQIAEELGMDQANPEGMLFPDTYFYSRGTSDLEILRRAHARLETILADTWQQRAVGIPLQTPYEALILASIVEKETSVGSERRTIAGVFSRRLQQGMRLQSDPTVIYGMGSRYTGNIDRDALDQETPYNTYRIPGLPPTPIALAGRESIEASVDPEPGTYLYFVSRGNGSHQFSSTLEEHNAAVQRYQLSPGAAQ